MKPELEPIPLITRFFQMEKDFSLFTLRTKEGFPIWDILRYHIYMELRKNNNSVSDKIVTKKYKNSKLSIFRKLLINIYYLLTPIRENLFFLTSRNKDIDGKYFDVNADSVFNLIENTKKTVIETSGPYGTYKYENSKVILISVIDLFQSKFLANSKLDDFNMEKVLAAIQVSFPKSNLSRSIINNQFSYFLKSYWFYSLLFKKNRGHLKRLFATPNRIQKGLFYAAKKHGIKIFEFQHGIIDKTHIAYSYNQEIEYKSTDAISPDILFTFSNYWATIFYNPFMKFISLGNDYFYEKQIPLEKNALTIISSNIHHVELKRFTIQIFNRFPQLQIYYKLHPNQFLQFDEIRDFFSKYVNIHVISNEFSVPQLISKSAAILTIVSTAVYEALHNNVKAIILKKDDYLSHQDIFDNPNVHLVDNLQNFEIALKTDYETDLSRQDLFFKPFNKKLFWKVIQ